MNRRNFLKKMTLTGAAPFMLSGIPVYLFARQSQLQQVAAGSLNDKVLVILQLHGGNDGLNTIVPVDQYSLYYNLRPNIAIPTNGSRKYIPLDSTLPIEDQVGLHPDMIGAKELYDQGKMAIVQGVSYENNNGSHFRGRDIWFMGGGYNDYFGSGWMGRYLDESYPGYPDNYPNDQMPDPLGLEIGTGISLAFHRESGIPAGLSVQNPQQFYDLINSTGGELPASIADSHYGDELEYIMGIEQQSNQYASRLKQVYEQGSNSSVIYPEKYPLNAPQGSLKNRLAGQLRLIARLLSGGIKTKIFLARIGGFDTHAEQVEPYDATMGKHAALLYHISSAMKAFQDDLRNLGLEDRVVSLTYSEFGRRPESNGSWGTDHGTGAPMLVFGKAVKPGIIGSNPDLANLVRNNVPQQYDYRQPLTTILQDWLGADDATLDKTLFGEFKNQKLDLIGEVTSSKDVFFDRRFRLENCYPNPVKDITTIGFHINKSAIVKITVYDEQGRVMQEVINQQMTPGAHEVQVDLRTLKAGKYIYRLETDGFNDAKMLIKK